MKKHVGVTIGFIISILLWIFFVIVARQLHAPHILLVGAFAAGIIGFLISIGVDKLLRR